MEREERERDRLHKPTALRIKNEMETNKFKNKEFIVSNKVKIVPKYDEDALDVFFLRGERKQMGQTFLEFAREKEIHFIRWFRSLEVGKHVRQTITMVEL